MKALNGRRRAPQGMPPVQKIDWIGWTEDESGCWIWNGRRDRDNYGLIDDLRGVPVAVHRVAYGKWVQAVPDGKLLMHSCDNPPCINPAHLSIGTQLDNLGDMSEKGRAWNQQKTHCAQGHEFSAENTKVWIKPNGRPGRKCIQCMRDSARRQAAKRVA